MSVKVELKTERKKMIDFDGNNSKRKRKKKTKENDLLKIKLINLSLVWGKATLLEHFTRKELSTQL